jgi:hypothetical protein
MAVLDHLYRPSHPPKLLYRRKILTEAVDPDSPLCICQGRQKLNPVPASIVDQKLCREHYTYRTWALPHLRHLYLNEDQADRLISITIIETLKHYPGNGAYFYSTMYNPTKTVSYTRRLFCNPRRIANENAIDLAKQLLQFNNDHSIHLTSHNTTTNLMLPNSLCKPRTPTFLLTFDQKYQINIQRSSIQEVSRCTSNGHDGPFVVRDTSAVEITVFAD